MADRVLTWFFSESPHRRDQPTYYADEDFEKSEVRIIADAAPVEADCTIDIFAWDYTGTQKASIFNNHMFNPKANSDNEQPVPDTTVSLPKGKTVDTAAENFIAGDILEGQLITCQMVASGGAKNVTVILELNRTN